MPSFGVDILQVCAEEHIFQEFGDSPLTRRTEGLAPRRGSESANAGDIRTEGQKDIRPLRGCGHGLTSAWPEGTQGLALRGWVTKQSYIYV